MESDGYKYPLIYRPTDGAEHCVCCGAIIPEGSIICPLCADGVEHKL